MFSRRGYHGASMNDVAEAAGVSKPVLYQHFGSKEELYVSLVGEVGNRLSRAVTEAIPTGTDPRSRIIAGLGAYFGFVAAHRDEFRLLFGSGTTREGALATGGATSNASWPAPSPGCWVPPFPPTVACSSPTE